MKNRLPTFVALAWLIFAIGCGKKQEAENILNLQPAGEAWGALYQQSAAEYKALCFQSYNLAKLRLDEQLKTPAKKPLAIVTDIDETVLDNSPYFSRLAQNGEVYSDSSWVKWTAEVRCDTVAGAAKFLKYAASQGVMVFYITNRFQRELAPTIKNLAKWNLPYADSNHVTLLTDSTTGSEEARRLKVSENYNIAMLLGDNLGDFDKMFDNLSVTDRNNVAGNVAAMFGDKFIVLPNAMYGTWEDALYKGKKSSSIADKNEVLRDNLK